MNAKIKPDTKVSFTVVQHLLEYVKSKTLRKEPVTQKKLEIRALHVFNATEDEIIKSVDFMIHQKVIIDANAALTTSHGLEATYIMNPSLLKRTR